MYKQRAEVHVVHNIQQLEAVLPAHPIGSLHSYSKIALADKVVKLEGEFKIIEHVAGFEWRIGAGATVKEVMLALQKKNQQLPNYGNHTGQTYVGAVKGGTHGYGKRPFMVDQVIKTQYVGGIATHVHILAEPQKLYTIDYCVCPLHHLPQGRVLAAYLPHADICITSKVTRRTAKPVISQFHSGKASWWKLRVWWWLDQTLPFIRRWIQKVVPLASMKTWSVDTVAGDLDYLYDPAPGLSIDTADFFLWAYKPTYTCFNRAFFVNREDLEQLLIRVKATSDLYDKSLLRCFIGLRSINSDKWAVDLYCSPKKASVLNKVVDSLYTEFDLIPHPAK